VKDVKFYFIIKVASVELGKWSFTGSGQLTFVEDLKNAIFIHSNLFLYLKNKVLKLNVSVLSEFGIANNVQLDLSPRHDYKLIHAYLKSSLKDKLIIHWNEERFLYLYLRCCL